MAADGASGETKSAAPDEEDSPSTEKTPGPETNSPLTGRKPTPVVNVVSTSGPCTVAAPAATQSVTVQRVIHTGPQTAGPSSVLMVTKAPAPRAGVTWPVSTPRATSAPGRTLMIAVPRATSPGLALRPPTAPSPQLPANFQIPPGMVLIRSDSGQLMLVSQQALAQVQNGQKASSVPAPALPTTKVPVATAGRKADKLTVIRVAASPSAQTAQKTAVIQVTREAPKPTMVQSNPVIGQGVQAGIKEAAAPKDPSDTITKETLENVKKCKNFLVTLIKLASSDSQSPNLSTNVRSLVRGLLEGSLEPEEFTDQLYLQLKSTPQPFLVPFLKKSLPVVRRFTSDPQQFIQQAGQTKPAYTTTSSTLPAPAKPSGLTPNPIVLDKQPRAVGVRPATMMANRTAPGGLVILSGQHHPLHPGFFSLKRPLVQDQQPAVKNLFKDGSGSYKEDDDINDVASMAGVNLREESARILVGGGTAVGSVVRSCPDALFLSASPLHARTLHMGQSLGVTEVGPDVVALVSHAAQERLRDLLEKLWVVSEHRRTLLKEDLQHAQVSDVRSQLHFMEQVELLKKQRRDEEERERLLLLAKRRSNSDDPQMQQLKQRAKELQQIELAQLQHREANLTALAAIGPRKKRPLDSSGNLVSVLAGGGVRRVTRVTMKDLLLCMEEDRHMRHSLTLYKTLLR